ncbi:hypothetical protein AXF42_Ash010797 [Apostasia shenzhenica]|uniref:Uncharacterized protein n=1 Tax=Apostasia shenzhenica TaxID=1088818 RepID=A0A2I0A0N6_9ASPA|nr:hypothetical protein AXF42_Ash010797 [Apostasia shenzhenica]
MASRLLSHTAVPVLILCCVVPVMSKMPDDYTSIREDQELVEKICSIGFKVFDKFHGKTRGTIHSPEALVAGMLFDLDRNSLRFYAKFKGLLRKDITATVEILYAMRPGFHVDLHVKNLDITSVKLVSFKVDHDGL